MSVKVVNIYHATLRLGKFATFGNNIAVSNVSFLKEDISRALQVFPGIVSLSSVTGSFLSVECRFSHDVTKIQNRKLSIPPRVYFHDVLGQLKTNFHTNFRFKRVFGFVIEYA